MISEVGNQCGSEKYTASRGELTARLSPAAVKVVCFRRKLKFVQHQPPDCSGVASMDDGAVPVVAQTEAPVRNRVPSAVDTTDSATK